jgi:magnesium chelatase family protein
MLVDRCLARISGPLLDRIGMHLRVPALPFADIASEHAPEPSAVVRERAEASRVRQRERFGGHPGVHANAHMSSREVRRHCRLDQEIGEILRAAVERLGLSARGCHRVLKLARTIADLAGAGEIGAPQVQEAIQYRSLDRRACPPP